MWGVRRRDAAKHNESGWLIRPEMRSSTPSLPLFLLLFYFPLAPPSHLPSYWSAQARKKDRSPC